MKAIAGLAFTVLLAACATAPVTGPPKELFNDHLFLAPSEHINVGDVFAMSDEMKRYLATEIAAQIRVKGRQQGLFDALYAKGELRLDYDSAMTRNPAQAFAARSGNCLSLVIMTAAFAKALDLPIRYKSAYLEEAWSRSNDAYFFIGHLNLSLGKRPQDTGFIRREPDLLTIDFLPPLEIRALRTREITESTVVAMYMNNRAAEALTGGQLDDAYGWAHMAILQDPGFLSSYNTLGAIYLRHGNWAEAEKVLAFALDREPANTHVMSNLAMVLNALGRVAESQALTRKLEQIEPDPPFAFFNRGVKAMRDRDFKAARDLFAKEVDRAPYYHEFHFWLGAAYLGLGQTEQARKELNLAIEYSTTRSDRDLYATKLDRINSHRLQ
jgi:Flp pilus assembly protein TadD